MPTFAAVISWVRAINYESVAFLLQVEDPRPLYCCSQFWKFWINCVKVSRADLGEIWIFPSLISKSCDYDSRKVRGSIYRTDSILKAIGKATIFRGYPKSNTIPFIVIGNSPPPKGYLDNIDASVASGIVQKYLSLTPNPLVVDPSDNEERNPKESDGERLKNSHKVNSRESQVTTQVVIRCLG